MVRYARKLTREPAAMTEEDLNTLRATGLSEEQVLSVVLIACTFNFMTRLADGLGVDIEARKAAAVAEWLEQREGPEWAFLRVAAASQEEAVSAPPAGPQPNAASGT